LTIDEAIIVATRLLPKDAPPSYLGLPGSAGKSYSVTGYYKGSAPFSQLATASFDARTGLLQTRSDTREQNRGDRAVQYFFALHFGAFGGEGLLGTLVKVLWFLLGTIPAVLAVTGFLMFWNRKLRQMRQPAYPAWMLVFSRRAKSLDQPSV
jgi:uncharacterized iron-regulated membrane protein